MQIESYYQCNAICNFKKINRAETATDEHKLC